MPNRWPPLPFDAWQDTYATLHMWTQIVGKVCLALTPLQNHFWNITFRMTPRGLVTPTLFHGDRRFTMLFDFVSHELRTQTSDGAIERIALEPRTVAEFYRLMMAALHALDLDVRIWPMPVEVPAPVRFDADTTHGAYDAAAAAAFWQALVSMQPVFERFRAGFIGKSSPVHFFWGSFDLAVTRFSGRSAPERPGADAITREAYSHEVISHGFWPGGAPLPEAAFYAYAAPEPDGLKTAIVAPAAGRYHTQMSEFILPYEAVRSSARPEEDLLAFLETSYAAAADLAGWDRRNLERTL
jgi:Family of unknown function (DUF5996)